jgi:pyridoxine/pyridoxamine 5'-phosphate oxidase
MTKREAYDFIRTRELAVMASVNGGNSPQAAVVAIAVTPELELIFDTVRSSRKYPNLKANPRIAFVIGWDDERTLQYEGEAHEPQGEELRRCQEIYFARYPDGRERLKWPGIVYLHVRPLWIRYSDFNSSSRGIGEVAL